LRKNGFHVNIPNIPIPVIILAYLCYFPAGVILTLLRIYASSLEDKQKKDEAVTNKVPAAVHNESKKQKGRKAKKSISAICLYILAVLFAFCGTILFFENAQSAVSIPDFIRNTLVGDSMLLFLLAGLSYAGGRFCKSKIERQNILRSIIGCRDSLNLHKLAVMADTHVKKVRKDLQTLIDKGEFGEEAYIDLEKNVFMRSPGVIPDVEPESSSVRFTADESENVSQDVFDKGQDNFRSVILEIRKLNDDIKDFAVSERIYRIEEHTQNIFDYVTDHPEAMNQIRTFMNYYLPTTLKLLESYRRIEQVGVAGENMKKSKESIENILDMLVVGFEQQVDQLFRHESIDISSEISVLETMMKQDGLNGRSDFDFGGAAAQSLPHDN